MRVAGLLQRNCCMQGGGGCLKTVKAVFFYKLNMPHHTDLLFCYLSTGAESISPHKTDAQMISIEAFDP